jgi:hypothetical protein
VGHNIGGLECVFFKKSQYIYKSATRLEGFVIRRRNLQAHGEEYPEMTKDFKRNLLNDFIRNIEHPMKLKMERMSLTKNTAE